MFGSLRRQRLRESCMILDMTRVCLGDSITIQSLGFDGIRVMTRGTPYAANA